MTAFYAHNLTEPGFGKSSVWDLNDAPADTSIDDLLKPENWSNVAAKLKFGDEIVVKPQGLPYRAHLIVLDAGKAFAKMRLLSVIILNGAEQKLEPKADALPEALPENSPVKVEWKGLGKYTVIRKADGEKLRGGFAIKAEAIAWAIQHVVAMAT